MPTPIRPDQSFRFSCSPAVSCFNDCCRNLNQLLTPYDILRLKNHLGLKSGEFLARYTRWHIGPGTGLPIVALKEADQVRRTCPFLTSAGCRVYAQRPSSCRIYPLVRTAGYDADSGESAEAYMILREPHCKGFMEAGQQSVAQWVIDQGLPEYNRFNDQLMAFISRKRRLRPGPLAPSDRRRVYMTLYDLDAFRDFINDRGALEGRGIDWARLERAGGDDLELLQLGVEWLNTTLFGSTG